MKKFFKYFLIFVGVIYGLGMISYICTPKEKLEEYKNEKQNEQAKQDSIDWITNKRDFYIRYNAEEFIKSNLRNPDSYENISYNYSMMK